MQPKAAIEALAAALGVGAVLLVVQRLVQRYRDRFDGLDSVVSFSSRLIAASRAVETEEEEHALVQDPLAKALACPKAFKTSLARIRDAPEGTGRKKLIGMMAIRTRWFDDQLLSALGVAVVTAVPPALLAPPASQSQQAEQQEEQQQGEAAAAAASKDGVASPYIWDGSEGRGTAPPPRQVVLLGAGMDSRAWRLPLPAGVRWFEVDRQDVLDAKRAMLEAQGAQLTGSPLAADTGNSQPGSSSSSSGNAAPVQPLRAASWTGVACDLCAPGWTQQLQAAGLDPTQPTVWVAEGLLMYLSRAEVEAMLKEMAGASAPGSLLIAMSVTDETIVNIQRNGSASELLSTWKFGCPPDPSEFLAAHGWRRALTTTRTRMARALGLNPALCGFKLEADKGSLFFVAGVAPQAAGQQPAGQVGKQE